ncbi:hypothetical protein KEM60_01462 [Austwickia sp. TVS 96-490-7B]|uniref:DUF1810 domain-containing protein n=1 Tax=Austwickia sp. TVS 96-490-7B TaxID=2830843 RepID=UPI001C594630|nr:DUF1810 domain-containing protein [Austwickia sp. TVS 96-490-7B]MBW3085265.1 hypothetical protein [Austwickia sp. TVS 96-490-7B]
MSVDLSHFQAAQDSHDCYRSAVAQILRGRKDSHWMWFIFPQVAGLGRSHMAQRFAISGRDDARAYLSHPVLGPRLHEASMAVLTSVVTDVQQIFGPVDAMKLRSSMTLFEAASTTTLAAQPPAGTPDGEPSHRTVSPVSFPADSDSAWTVFSDVLDGRFGGSRDDLTLARLG